MIVHLSAVGLALVLGLAADFRMSSPERFLDPWIADVRADEPQIYQALVFIDGERTWIEYEEFSGTAYSGEVLIGDHWRLQVVTYDVLASELANLERMPDGNRRLAAASERLRREGARYSALTDREFPPGPPPPPRTAAYWPGGVIPYRLDASVTDQRLKGAIAEAAKIWSTSGAGFVFRLYDPRLDGDGPVLTIYDANHSTNVQRRTVSASTPHCRAEVGWPGSKAPSRMWVSPNCAQGGAGVTPEGRILHEFAHVIGLMHEHQRADRSFYFNGAWAGMRHADLRTYAETDLKFPLLGDYDPCSITHYPLSKLRGHGFGLSALGEVAFNRCSSDLPPPCRTIGQRCELTLGDIAAARAVFEYEKRFSDRARTGADRRSPNNVS